MSDPYSPPGPIALDDGVSAQTKKFDLRQLLVATASGIVVGVLSIVSIALIAQALRLDSDVSSIPSRLRADSASTSHSSWIGGGAAITGVVLNAIGLLLARKNKLLIPVLFLVMTIIGMVAIAVICKPS